MKRINSEYELDALRYASQGYAAIGAWSNAGLWTTVAEHPHISINELPTDPRATRQTIPLLVHLGLINFTNDKLTLTASARALHQSGALTGNSAKRSLGDLSRLDAVLVAGGPVADEQGNSRVSEGGVRETDRNEARQFMEMLYRRSAQSTALSAEHLKPLMKPGTRILDLGGGHGRYGADLAAQGAHVTLMDKSVCVDLAKERYQDKLEYIAGDFFTDDLGGPYDIVFLSNIVHGLGPDELAQLFKRMTAVTSQGGYLVLKDMFIDEHGGHPEEAVFFNITMLMYTREGRSYSVAEMRKISENAGFAEHSHLYFADQRFSLLVYQLQEK